jgi:hypothetical protein
MTRLACLFVGRCGHRRLLPALVIVLVLGAAKLPIEHELSAVHRQEHLRGVEFNLDLRERVGQLGFIAALSGFRSIVADVIFMQTRVAWERTEWGRLLWLFRQVTTLQPRAILFWDMAAWHMAWNASVAAMNDRTQPRLALRIKAQKEYFALGKDFLERGIKNNPKDRSSTSHWRGCTKRNTKITRARPNCSPTPRPCPARRVTTNGFPPTSFPIAKAVSARPINVCANSTTRVKTNDCRL